MLFNGWGHRIQPVNCSKIVLHGSGGFDIHQAKWNDGFLVIDCKIDLLQGLRGLVGIIRKDQQEDFAIDNGVHDRPGPFHPGQHITRCNPAANSTSFQSRANGIRHHLVLRRVADKNIMRHIDLNHLATAPLCASMSRAGRSGTPPVPGTQGFA